MAPPLNGPPCANFTSRPSTVYKRMSQLLRTSQWSDCTFLVGEGESKEEFRAHRLILASCSPVFEVMCFGPLAETASVSIPDLEPSAFRILLEYAYTDNVVLNGMEAACDVLYAAKKYMLEHLTHICHKYIINNLQVNDVCAVYEYAKLLQEETLYETCLLMMRKYALEILSDAALHILPATVTELLSSDAINGCEYCLIEGTLSWASRECEQRGLPSTGSNQRAILNECGAWQHLRLLTLSPQQFARISQIEDLLTCEETLLIQEFLTKWNGSKDDKKIVPCANSCNINSLHIIPVKKLAEDSNDSSSNPNVIVVRDKWKRRRLNMVLTEHNSRTINSLEVTEDNAELNEVIGDEPDQAPPPTVSLPSSISHVLKRRVEVGYRLTFCRRPWLKQSTVIKCPVTLQLSLRVSAPIDLRAVQLYTRLIPPTVALFKSNHYKEKLELSIFDSGNLISHQYFTDKVQFNTETLVYLNKFVRLRQDRTYLISVRLLDSVAEYPLSFLGAFADSQGIVFQCLDGGVKGETKSFVNRLDMGFISGFAYS